jgi:uncharacterized protein (DUF111 family)
LVAGISGLMLLGALLELGRGNRQIAFGLGLTAAANLAVLALSH